MRKCKWVGIALAYSYSKVGVRNLIKNNNHNQSICSYNYIVNSGFT